MSESLVHDPFEALRHALATSSPASRDATVNLDFDRDIRTGVPEVILAEGKAPEIVLDVARRFLERRGRAIVSRVRPRVIQLLRDETAAEEFEAYPLARMAVLRTAEGRVAPTGGCVAIVTAGASDLGTAQEAQVIAQEMGCATRLVGDVGVAGLHRLVNPLQDLLAWGADAIVVVAGMDGALPSVVAGLVDVPVIGLPTSKGYGIGSGGLAAILSMLQSCVPGLVVVNVDNGIGAGASAARIANRVAAARAGH